MLAELLARLGELAPKRVGAQVLDLGRIGVDLPVGGVGVAPLRADRDRAGLDRPQPQPLTEELLGSAVGAGGVEVANAGRIRGVEHLMCAPFHSVHRALVEVAAVTEVQVPGSPERREAKRDRRRRDPRRAERAAHLGHRTASGGATHPPNTRSSSSATAIET